MDLIGTHPGVALFRLLIGQPKAVVARSLFVPPCEEFDPLSNRNEYRHPTHDDGSGTRATFSTRVDARPETDDREEDGNGAEKSPAGPANERFHPL
ncbi:hypothetical protein [Natrarchaeobius oligotrophus]|uniref:hypothetical protein n=1 Tax=Natrarchaeobius oligotrophus TaxID=3455743 RepID=UPI000F535B48|nr:hypothetical protein [Natrarchaeobius chitinivorans]